MARGLQSISALSFVCFLAMATLNDGDIIRTAVGAAAPPQPHNAKVSNIRRFPVRSTFLQNNKFPYCMIPYKFNGCRCANIWHMALL